MKHMLPPYHPSDDRYSSFSSDDSGAALTLNLRLLETSPLGTDGQRRPSFDSVESSVPPELLSASSVGTMSPSTPLNGCSFGSNCGNSFRTTAPHIDLQTMWSHQQDGSALHDFGYSPAVPKEQLVGKYFNVYSMDANDCSASFYTPSCTSFLNDDISPALSRPMFNDSIPSSTPLPRNDHTNWPSITVAYTPPRTIDPSRFAPLVPSTPTAKLETPCTPSHQHMRSSITLSSSPMPGYSPGIVPSQHEIDDSAYFDSSNIHRHDAVDISYEPMNICMDVRDRDHNRDRSRLSRRRYDRKGIGSGCKRRPSANKSGFECDRVITANSFACSYPECIDKNTGKQKRFKRQEHKKRHEKTVHQKDSHMFHHCWVPLCEKAFTRTDNLKSHLRNTHGKRSANARNRYVATLDPNNIQYYDPDWEGDLDTDGLPIGSRAVLTRL